MPEELKYLAETLFVIVAGVWIYFKFISGRQGEPGADLTIDLDFAGRQDGHWLVEIAATLANKSQVRQWYTDFQVVVRYLLPEDKICDGPEKLNYQLTIPRTVDERIQNKERYFANSVYINPRLTFRHSYVTSVPENATFVLVQCKMRFRSGIAVLTRWGKFEVKNGQKLFRVPSLAAEEDA